MADNDIPGKKFLEEFASILRSFQKANPQVQEKHEFSVPAISSSSPNEDKEQAFKSALEELSGIEPQEYLDDAEIQSFADFFKDLYGGDGFRHRYAVICKVMYDHLTKESKLDEGVPYTVRNMADNVELICAFMKRDDTYSDVVGRVLKLNDHIELEVTRMEYLRVQSAEIKDMKSSLKKEIETTREHAAEMEERHAALQRKLTSETIQIRNDLQKNSITILGIFAAVVMVFNGAVGLFSSSVTSASAISTVRGTAFVVLIVGFVLFNTVVALLRFLERASKGPEDDSCDKGTCWHVLLFDLALIAGIVVSGYGLS